MANILLLTTTTGDTNAIRAIALAFIEQAHQVTIVALGPIAVARLAAAPVAGTRVIDVAQHFSGQYPQQLSGVELTALQARQGQFDLVVSGSPSPDAEGRISALAFQLLEYFQDVPQGVYSDYLFYPSRRKTPSFT